MHTTRSSFNYDCCGCSW